MYVSICIHIYVYTYMSILYVAIRDTRVVVVVVYAYVVRTRRETFYLRYKSRGYILIMMVQLLERGTRLNLYGVIRRGCAEYKNVEYTRLEKAYLDLSRVEPVLAHSNRNIPYWDVKIVQMLHFQFFHLSIEI